MTSTTVPARRKALAPTDLSFATPEGTHARIVPDRIGYLAFADNIESNIDSCSIYVFMIIGIVAFCSSKIWIGMEKLDRCWGRGDRCRLQEPVGIILFNHSVVDFVLVFGCF